MVSKGHFLLHSRAKPPLPADDYVLEGEQQIPDGDGGHHATEDHETHIRVMSPRFRLPPDQILSTFPPANSEGAYESRLPQIVIKRRTLPWEREVDADPNTPWLALVVIAESEGSISEEVPVAECVSEGVTLSGYNDTPTGVYLSVPQTTVTKVFPTKQDLHLLAHVRQVDISDTELAMGDDDGFLAVVMANRLPQFDRVACKPLRYLACLINLEGQLDALPPPSPPVLDFFPEISVFQNEASVAFLNADTDHAIMGGEQLINTLPEGEFEFGEAGPAPRVAGASPRAVGGSTADSALSRAQRRHVASTAASSTVNKANSQQWQMSPQNIEDLAVSSSAVDAPKLVRDAMASNFKVPLESFVQETMYRFPVLTHWSFTCAGAGSFETLMQGLDVGMLGTVAGRPSGKPTPECYEPPPVDGPPEPESARPEAELAETGHVGLEHLTRRGERIRSWYRGPFVPHLSIREAADDLAHVSDQLRRLIPDGREDVAFAGGFEIGRLLALSQPAVVAALMRWRREQFGAARVKRFGAHLLDAADIFSHDLEASVIGTMGLFVERNIIDQAIADKHRFLAESRPFVDPGRPMDLPDRPLEEVIATGFGLQVDTVKQALFSGDAQVLENTPVPGAAISLQTDSFTHLHQRLDQVLVQLSEDALSVVDQTNRPRAGTTRRAAVPENKVKERGADQLKKLLGDANRRAREERES